MIKKIILKLIHFIISFINKTKLGLFIFQKLIDSLMDVYETVEHKNFAMKFSVPNWINSYRIRTFSTKEPETLSWIDDMKSNSILWDIGANVGLYSIYSAKSKNCKVYAFEPSVFNLELLARNIYLNNLQHKVTIIPVSLSNEISENLFQLSSTQWGGALSTFGAGINQDGKKINDVFQYSTVGLSIDDAFNKFKIPKPDYVKIDVDGIEHLILSGIGDVFKNVISILVEVNEDFDKQKNLVNKILTDNGFYLYKKYNIDSTNQFNQLWKRQK